MKVVGDAGLSVADPGNVNAVSKKPKTGKRRGGRGSRDANTQGNTQCNVVPLHLYKKATKDVDLCNVTPVNTAIISYGGTSIPILGKVRLRVWRGDFRCLLDCNLVDSKKESDGEVYTHDVPASSPVSADQLIKCFPSVFADGVGALAGEYHMVLDESAFRRLLIAIRERLREILEDLEKREIIARVTTPTP
ncbi:unnamed protein product [Porites evermanni]|uniref:Uncharacterized protein n=1 Tax=Porites evermanni TaxID=104178 RepID=A0ABN8PLG9_9CNID|nr:unnamed protein product [Porites evermanni]